MIILFKPKPENSPDAKHEFADVNENTPELVHERSVDKEEKLRKDFQFNEMNGRQLIPFEM